MGLAALFLVTALASASPVAAQSCSGSGRYNLRPQPTQVQFPAPTAADYEAGYVESDVLRIRVRPRGRANRSWELCIASDELTLGGNKPISDVSWQLDGAGSWSSLSQTEVPVTPGFGNQWVSVRFRIALDWAQDGPGTYRAEVLFVSHRS